MNRPLKGEERTLLLDELHDRYAGSKQTRKKFLYWRKKYSWILIVEGAKALKRFLDIVISLALLILLFPFLVLIALLIKLDGGPVLYVTDRVGKWGREFPFPKFRTMRPEADREKEQWKTENIHGDGVTFKMKKDPRVTPIGRFLRKSSLDELPQLWNVLKGEMSLVGPRPPLPEEVAHYTLSDRRRLDVKPGLTCIWQVSGRSEIPFPEQVRLDIKYIESQSIWTDLKLLLQTIPAVLFGRGAY